MSDLDLAVKLWSPFSTENNRQYQKWVQHYYSHLIHLYQMLNDIPLIIKPSFNDFCYCLYRSTEDVFNLKKFKYMKPLVDL